MSIRFWQGVVHYNTLSVKVILVAHCSLVAVPPPGQVGTPRIIVVPGLSAAQSAQKVAAIYIFFSLAAKKTPAVCQVNGKKKFED